ncbi:MAG: 30S ribosomal protein S5 [Microgenomates group bacterium ADurb.Bin219]|mgnify:CR=1 FL=1|nr:MAG: 30S ribosomal protein S5 [Microgenomates group bacterium ADurb.Bin219]HNP89205.1 30S ribosomal protein S5 [Candidatus Woesebacteria bacterium]
MIKNFSKNGPAQSGNDEFSEKVVRVSRVSKKRAGGSKISFSAIVVVGDKKGKVGVGLGKAPTVSLAVAKGSAYAKRHLVEITLRKGTIIHEVRVKRGAAKILLKPAPEGSGIIAGGSVRAVVEMAGIKNISSKILGTGNQASNIYATLEALKQLSVSQ